MTNNAMAYWKMFKETMANGNVVKPRGKEIRELENYQITIDPTYPFMGFAARKYNVNYFKREMLWKLTGNKYDETIKAHAKMWESVQNPDGTFNSNYGQYWFGEQQGLMGVVFELLRDVDSRRAVIPMLSKEHMKAETIDTVCTECVGFRIRGGRLNMSVHMRSSDQIFGLGTDIPTFAFIYFLVFACLKDRLQSLEVGDLTVHAMSSHIYSTHYEMVKAILEDGIDAFSSQSLPVAASACEALQVIGSRGVVSCMPDQFQEFFRID